MSRFHFDEGALNGAVLALGSIKTNIGNNIVQINNTLLELYGSDGFNINYAIDGLSEEIDKVNTCVQKIEMGERCLNSVEGTVRLYTGNVINSAINKVESTINKCNCTYSDDEFDWKKELWKQSVKVISKAGIAGKGFAFCKPIMEMIYKNKNGTLNWDDYTSPEYVVSVLSSRVSMLGAVNKLDTSKPVAGWLLGFKEAVSGSDINTLQTNWWDVFKGNVNKADGFVDDYKWVKNGKSNKLGSALAWGDLILSGISNGISNYQEFERGEISSDRAAKETIFETFTDSAIKWSIGTLAAGACATIGSTAVVAGAITVGAIWALDGGVKWLNKTFLGIEKGLTETVSDFYLDLGENLWGKATQVGSCIVSSAKSTISYIGNGLSQIGSSIKRGFKSLFA